VQVPGYIGDAINEISHYSTVHTINKTKEEAVVTFNSDVTTLNNESVSVASFDNMVANMSDTD